MGSCAAPSAKGDDKFITTDYLQQCRFLSFVSTTVDQREKRGEGLPLYQNAKVIIQKRQPHTQNQIGFPDCCVICNLRLMYVYISISWGKDT
ncbi:hypothetical protein AM386_00145 (plasmid) [Klebsiella pneumoniae]|nr:hypothetical protein AM386_00145 [Klebsiella pneumoniae]ATM40542.1 hypothetical protein CRN23_27755 [Klebsiella pneumoniae]